MADTDCKIVPFNQTDHIRFVSNSFLQSLNDMWPWRAILPTTLLTKLKHHLASPSARCLVALNPEDPTDFMGWALADPHTNCVIFAFTKYRLRRFGLCTSLLKKLEIDLAKPIGVHFWTRASERIARKPRYPLYFRIAEEDQPIENGSRFILQPRV